MAAPACFIPICEICNYRDLCRNAQPRQRYGRFIYFIPDEPKTAADDPAYTNYFSK